MSAGAEGSHHISGAVHTRPPSLLTSTSSSGGSKTMLRSSISLEGLTELRKLLYSQLGFLTATQYR